RLINAGISSRDKKSRESAHIIWTSWYQGAYALSLRLSSGRITRSAAFRAGVGFRPAAREAAGMSKRARRKPANSKRPKSKLGLAAATINGRLAAVRRLAYEAADAGLLSPELAANIRRVKGPKKLGVRLGNWLTADEARRFWQTPDPETLKGKRDRAILAILL